MIRVWPPFLCLAAGMAAGVLFPAGARADVVVLMPHQGDERLEQAREHATRVLRGELEAQGLSIVSHEQASAAAGELEGADCEQINCAHVLIRAAGADGAAAVAVWGENGGLPKQIFVTLMDARGARYPGEAAVEDGDLPRATRAALLDARALQLLGPGPWLRVGGQPEGARVLLDGTLVGNVPYRIAIKPGRHVLEVKLEGYRPHLQNVDIPPNDTKQVKVEVELAPRDAGEAVATIDGADYLGGDIDEPGGGRSAVHTVGPILLGVAGAAVLAQDIAMIASEGCDRSEPTGACTKGTEVDTAQAIALGGTGVAAILGAILWYALANDGPDEHAAIRPHGAGVAGSF